MWMSVYGDVQLSLQIGDKRLEQGQRHFEAVFKSYFFVHFKDLDASHTKFL